MGKTERNGKKVTQLKWPKYQKAKDENGMNETLVKIKDDIVLINAYLYSVRTS